MGSTGSPSPRAYLTPNKHAWVTMPNLIAVGQTVGLRVKIRRKTGLLLPRLSQSLKVIGIETDRSY